MCLYIDDVIYMSSSDSLVAVFKSNMMKKFEMSNMGLLHYFLSLKVKQGVDEIFISQRKYVVDLLKRVNLFNCKPATTPMNTNENLELEDGTEEANAKKYRSLVGGLIYLTHTRPDIAFSISVFSRFI